MQQKIPGRQNRQQIRLEQLIPDGPLLTALSQDPALAATYRKVARRNLKGNVSAMLRQVEDDMKAADSNVSVAKEHITSPFLFSDMLQKKRQAIEAEVQNIQKELPTLDTELNHGKPPVFEQWLANHNKTVNRLGKFYKDVQAFLTQYKEETSAICSRFVEASGITNANPFVAKTEAFKAAGHSLSPTSLRVISKQYGTSLFPDLDKITERLHRRHVMEDNIIGKRLEKLFTLPNKAIADAAKDFLLSHRETRSQRFEYKRVNDNSFMLNGFFTWNSNRDLDGSTLLWDLKMFLEPKFVEFSEEAILQKEAKAVEDALRKWGKEITIEMQKDTALLAKASGVDNTQLTKHRATVDALAKEQAKAKNQDDLRAQVARRVAEAQAKQREEEAAKLRELRKDVKEATASSPTVSKNAQKKEQEQQIAEAAARLKEQEEAAKKARQEEGKNAQMHSPVAPADSWVASVTVKPGRAGLEDFTKPLPVASSLPEADRNQLQIARDYLARLHMLLENSKECDSELLADALRYSLVKICDALKTLPTPTWIRLFEAEDIKALRNGLVHQFHNAAAADIINMAEQFDERLRPCFKTTETGELTVALADKRLVVRTQPLFIACTDKDAKVSDKLYMQHFSTAAAKLTARREEYEHNLKLPATDTVVARREVLRDAIVTNLATMGNCTRKLSDETQRANLAFISATSLLRDIRRQADHSEFGRATNRTVNAWLEKCPDFGALGREAVLPPSALTSRPVATEAGRGAERSK